MGKSTLLTNLAGVYSEVAAYEFTTLTTVPGVIRYKGAKIQVLYSVHVCVHGIHTHACVQAHTYTHTHTISTVYVDILDCSSWPYRLIRDLCFESHMQIPCTV